MPKSETCTWNGRSIGIQTALEIRDRSTTPDFRCPECGDRVRPHKAGANGPAAHFEHLKVNPRCLLSGAR
jgi:hypothetical protein